MDTTNKPKSEEMIEMTPSLTTKEWISESVEEHLTCVLCGTELEFKHKTDFISLVVTEDAHCPGCRVRPRSSSHTLQ